MNHKSLVTTGALLLGASTTCWAAQGGAGLYKKKCAHCHGANGEGKPAIKAPALKGTTLEVSQLAEQITKGKSGAKAPHNKGISGLNDEHAKEIADYIKTLK